MKKRKQFRVFRSQDQDEHGDNAYCKGKHEQMDNQATIKLQRNNHHECEIKYPHKCGLKSMYKRVEYSIYRTV